MVPHRGPVTCLQSLTPLTHPLHRAGVAPKTESELASEFVTGGVHHDFVKEYYETMTEKTDEVYVGWVTVCAIRFRHH